MLTLRHDLDFTPLRPPITGDRVFVHKKQSVYDTILEK